MADEPMSLTVPGDRERFAELERIIEHGLGTFVEVGRALLEIQQRRLYRAAGHRTFADYVEVDALCGSEASSAAPAVLRCRRDCGIRTTP